MLSSGAAWRLYGLESCTSGKLFELLHAVRYDHQLPAKSWSHRKIPLWWPYSVKSNMAANHKRINHILKSKIISIMCNTSRIGLVGIRNPLKTSVLQFKIKVTSKGQGQGHILMKPI